ncbi:MAG: hypothetical protein ACI9Y1_001281 [Lentisphaeria bacterium]
MRFATSSKKISIRDVLNVTHHRIHQITCHTGYHFIPLFEGRRGLETEIENALKTLGENMLNYSALNF